MHTILAAAFRRRGYFVAGTVLLITVFFVTDARAQGTYFGYWGNSFVSGGGISNNPTNGPGYVTDLYMELRATSGAAGAGGNGYINWVFNDSDTIAIGASDYGGGLNWPYIQLGGWDDYGNWVYMWIMTNEWWPNDNQMHTLRMQLLQAGYGASSRKDINVSMDGRYLPNASISADPGSVVHIPLYNGGNFNLGWGTQVGISRFSATEGLYPNAYYSPVYVGNGAGSAEAGGLPGDLTYNQGYGENLLYFPDVSFEIEFPDPCPGC